MRPILLAVLFLLLPPTAQGSVDPLHSSMKNPQAIETALRSEEKVVNAAWWGFDKEDSTPAIQSAIDSGAKKVVVPYVGHPWIVRPIRLAGDQELYFEPGVLILAKKGEFLGAGDSCFKGINLKNLKISGYGATIRMRKLDYTKPPYAKGEWRMGISLIGCEEVLIEGLRIESTGGDGIYLGEGQKVHYCKNIVIRDVVCHDNYRQGMSIIGVDGLLVERCVFSDTWGTPPAAGIDFEPNTPQARLANCLFRDCTFRNNEGHEIHLYAGMLGNDSYPISITLENCLVQSGATEGEIPTQASDPSEYGWAGINLQGLATTGATGTIEFVDCTVLGSGRESVCFIDKDPDRVKVTFTNCNFRSPWLVPHPNYPGYRVPIRFEIRHPDRCARTGGVDFVDCEVFDPVNRPVIYLENPHNDNSLEKVSGHITRFGSETPELRIGRNPRQVDLEVVPSEEKEKR